MPVYPACAGNRHNLSLSCLSHCGWRLTRLFISLYCVSTCFFNAFSVEILVVFCSIADLDMVSLYTHRHTHTQPFNGLLSRTTRVGRYQKKHSPTHTHPDHRTSFIIFLHLQRSMASSLFSLRAWQSSWTTSLQVLFGLPLGLGPSTTYSMHFFTQSS